MRLGLVPPTCPWYNLGGKGVKRLNCTLHVKVFDEWHELNDRDTIDGISIDAWSNEHNLMKNSLPRDFYKVSVDGQHYLLHKSSFLFVAD